VSGAPAGDEVRATLHDRLHALTMFLVALQDDGFFSGERGRHNGPTGWRAPTRVATVALRRMLEHLEAEIGESDHFDCYSDGMLGYTVAETVAETFARCDEWGEEGRDAREEALELLLRYWRVVCTVDSPSPAMDLNKRIASAIGSVIGADLDLAERALRLAEGAHATILMELHAVEDAVRQHLGLPQRASAPLIPDEVLRRWRRAVDAWLAAGPDGGATAAEAADVIAAWADTLRVAADERGWDGPSIVPVVEDIGQLTVVVAPAVLRRAAEAPVGRLAVALTRLVIATPDDTEAGQALAMHVRAGLVMVSGRSLRARRAVERWAEEHGVVLPREIVHLLTPVGGPPDEVPDEVSDVPNLGLFDGADVTALAAEEELRERMRRTIERIVDARVDRFLVELLVDEEPITYVQGLWEDEGTLHVELANGSFVDAVTPPDLLPDLRRLGWNDPTDELPNHWQLLDMRELTADAVAGLLVRSMDLAHDPFSDLHEEAVLGVSPAAAALVGLGDEVPIHAVDLDGVGEYTRVVAPDIRPSGLLPASVVAKLLRRLTEARRDVRFGGRPSEHLGEAARALRATAAAGIALREGEGATEDEAIAQLLDVAVRTAERSAPGASR
jgi:hypothetical protein